MTELEKFILENAERFNDAEPDPGHFARFEGRLNKLHSVERSSKRLLYLKIAAAALVLLTAGTLVLDLARKDIRHMLDNRTASVELPGEVQEAMNYYDMQAEKQMKEIAGKANSRDAQATATSEVKTLDANTAELKEALKENPGNEHIMNALIRSQQMKEKVVRDIAEKIK